MHSCNSQVDTVCVICNSCNVSLVDSPPKRLLVPRDAAVRLARSCRRPSSACYLTAAVARESSFLYQNRVVFHSPRSIHKANRVAPKQSFIAACPCPFAPSLLVEEMLSFPRLCIVLVVLLRFALRRSQPKAQLTCSRGYSNKTRIFKTLQDRIRDLYQHVNSKSTPKLQI